jgi:hypothetical protein
VMSLYRPPSNVPSMVAQRACLMILTQNLESASKP